MLFDNDLTYMQALGATKMIHEESTVNLNADDFAFLTTDKMWTGADRQRVRLCVEACVYGACDVVGMPRFEVPAEYVAAAIAYYVHPINIKYAVAEMGRVEWSINVINGVEEPVKPNVLFAHVMRIKSGIVDQLNMKFDYHKVNLKDMGVQNG